MDALVMCGGPGTRLDTPREKPLLEINGTPMLDRVLAALDASPIDTTYPVTSPHTPNTRDHLTREHIHTPGTGYVKDLNTALADDRITTPVLTVTADLPLLAPTHISTAIDAHDTDSVVVCVPTALKHHLGLSAEETPGHGGPELAPTGLNIVTTHTETIVTSYDVRLAVNVNTTTDATIAESLA